MCVTLRELLLPTTDAPQRITARKIFESFRLAPTKENCGEQSREIAENTRKMG